MRLLLDMHTLHWYVEGDSRISERAKALVLDLKNGFFREYSGCGPPSVAKVERPLKLPSHRLQLRGYS